MRASHVPRPVARPRSATDWRQRQRSAQLSPKSANWDTAHDRQSSNRNLPTDIPYYHVSNRTAPTCARETCSPYALVFARLRDDPIRTHPAPASENQREGALRTLFAVGAKAQGCQGRVVRHGFGRQLPWRFGCRIEQRIKGAETQARPSTRNCAPPSPL